MQEAEHAFWMNFERGRAVCVPALPPPRKTFDAMLHGVTLEGAAVLLNRYWYVRVFLRLGSMAFAVLVCRMFLRPGSMGLLLLCPYVLDRVLVDVYFYNMFLRLGWMSFSVL